MAARLSAPQRAAMARSAEPDAAADGSYIDPDTATAFAVLGANTRRAADHRRLLRAALEQALNDRPGRAVRLLELGAGYGEGIERALPALHAAGARVEYFYADPSPARAAFVASRFADRLRLRSIALDPDALAAAARDRGFDLILADSASGEAANPLRVRAAIAWLATDGELLLTERDDAPRDWTATLVGAGLAPLHGRAPTEPAAVRLHRLRRVTSPSSTSTTTTPGDHDDIDDRDRRCAISTEEHATSVMWR